MNRREFSSILVGAVASSLLPTSAPVQQPRHGVPHVSDQATQLYTLAFVLDCNSGPPWEGGRLPLSQIDLDMVRNCGVDVVKCPIGGFNSHFAETVKQIGYIHRLIELHPAYFLQVRVPADLECAKREGKMGIIFSFESVEMLEGKLERIGLFRDLGVRVMQLSYNRKSAFAAGVLEHEGRRALFQTPKPGTSRKNMYRETVPPFPWK